MVLIEHQRVDITACRCGWSAPGKSFAAHQVGLLAAEGVFRPQARPERVADRLREWHQQELSREGYRGPQQPYDDDYWLGLAVAALDACGVGDLS